VTTGGIRRATIQSNRHHQQTNTQYFYKTGCSSCHPTNSAKALKEKVSHSLILINPSSPGVIQPFLRPLKAPGYLGEGCKTCRQPSDTGICLSVCLSIIYLSTEEPMHPTAKVELLNTHIQHTLTYLSNSSSLNRVSLHLGEVMVVCYDICND